MHGEGKHIAPSHGCMNRLLSLLGGYTVQMRNQDSWEGYSWGSKNVWGGEPVGEMQPSANLWPDIAKNAELLLFWAGDPEVTAVGFDGYMASRLSQWIHSLGIKFVHIDPALNFSGCYLADKWIPIKPNTDAALYLGIIYVWLKEGLYDKEYVETHAVGYDEFFDYVLGKEDGEPKTPAWASEKTGIPEWTIKALARDWAHKVTSVTIGNGGPGIRGAFSTEPARLQSICLGMQGLGKPGRHQAKWIEWNLHTDTYPMPHQSEKIIDLPHRCEIVRPAGSSQDLNATGLLGMEEEKKRQEELEKQKALISGKGTQSASNAAAFFAKGKEEGRYRLSESAAAIEELAEICKTTENPPMRARRHPEGRDLLVRPLFLLRPGLRAVGGAHLPRQGLLPHPRHLDRRALHGHLLERRLQFREGRAQRGDRIHHRPAALAGKRLPAGGHRAAGADQV